MSKGEVEDVQAGCRDARAAEGPAPPSCGAPSGPRWKRTWGFGLWGAACLLWVGLPVVPFLPLATSTRWWIGGVTLVAAEGSFLVGTILLGPEMARKVKGWIRDRVRKEASKSR